LNRQMTTFKPIKISYLWDRKNFENSFENAYKYQFQHSAKRYIGWFFVALAQFGVVAALKGGSVALLMFSTLLLFYWYVGKKWLVKRRAKAQFENSPFKDKNIEITVNEKGLEQNGLFTPWEQIEGVVGMGDAIMLYQDGKSYYIPENGFASVEEKSRFKALAKEKGKFYA